MPPSPEQFVHWFRAAAPYVNAFRGRTFVIAFGGEVVADGKFVALTHDLNLLASFGVRLVLVHGTRPQIESQIKLRAIHPRYVHGLRVTDEASMQCVKQANGQLRVEIEALLSMGLPDSPMANATNHVAIDDHRHRRAGQGGCQSGADGVSGRAAVLGGTACGVAVCAAIHTQADEIA